MEQVNFGRLGVNMQQAIKSTHVRLEQSLQPAALLLYKIKIYRLLLTVGPHEWRDLSDCIWEQVDGNRR